MSDTAKLILTGAVVFALAGFTVGILTQSALLGWVVSFLPAVCYGTLLFVLKE